MKRKKEKDSGACTEVAQTEDLDKYMQAVSKMKNTAESQAMVRITDIFKHS